MKRTLGCLLLSLTLASAACNSTNRLATSDPKGDDTDLLATGEGVDRSGGGDVVDSSATTSPLDASALGSANRTGSTATGARTPGAGTGAGGAGTPSPGGIPSAGFVGPGVTASEIKIGMTLVQTGTIFGDVTGVPVDFGDTRAQANAAVEYMNRTGGIAGRTVKPVYYTFDLGRPGLTDGQSEQEACSAWTEDNRVFAGINGALARQALLVCLAGRGVPGIHDGMPIDDVTLNKYRGFWYASYGGAGLTLDRLAEKQVKVYAGQGLFGANAVVGIEHFDDPAYKRVVENVFKPELAKVGVKRVVTQAAPRGGFEATSYVTNFRREGVTHVLFLGEGGLYPLFFMRAAEDQQWFPKYGVHTDMALGQLLQLGAPPRQLANANAMGWAPVVDVDNAHDPGPVSASNSLCLDIMRKAGQDMGNRGAMATALGYCNGLFLLRQALSPVTQITVAGLSAGMAALGTSYESPGVFGTRFTSQQHDGAAAYRDLRFLTAGGCNCFSYSGPIKPFPA